MNHSLSLFFNKKLQTGPFKLRDGQPQSQSRPEEWPGKKAKSTMGRRSGHSRQRQKKRRRADQLTIFLKRHLLFNKYTIINNFIYVGIFKALQANFFCFRSFSFKVLGYSATNFSVFTVFQGQRLFKPFFCFSTIFFSSQTFLNLYDQILDQIWSQGGGACSGVTTQYCCTSIQWTKV